MHSVEEWRSGGVEEWRSITARRSCCCTLFYATLLFYSLCEEAVAVLYSTLFYATLLFNSLCEEAVDGQLFDRHAAHSTHQGARDQQLPDVVDVPVFDMGRAGAGGIY
jgi:hypothetical protein